MIIKSFTAESASAALKKVRQEMGGDAVVLKTRRIEGADPTRRLEITALLDKPSVAQSSTILADKQQKTPETNRMASRMAMPVEEEPKDTQETVAPPAVEETIAQPERTQDDSAMNSRLASIEEKLEMLFASKTSTEEIVEEAAEETTEVVEDEPQVIDPALKARMIDADLPADYIEQLLNSDETGDEESIRAKFTDDVANMTSSGIEFKPGDRVVFIGTAASGKTSAMGKLSARLVLNGSHKIKLTTLDNLKIGAFDEIHNYAELLGIDVTDPSGNGSTEAIKDGITIIDTPALSPQADKLQTLKDKIKDINPTHCLVTVSAMTRTSDLAKFLGWINEFEPTHLVGTMLDMTDRYGSLISACQTTGLKMTFVTDAPGGMGAIKATNPDIIVSRTLDREVESE